MGGRKSRYIKEVLDWYREEDARDLMRNVLNEVVESMTALHALKGNIWKSETSNQNIVMNEKFVKNIVTDAKLDPKVVMDLSIFKIGGWNTSQPSNRNLLEELTDENEPWLLIGIPNRDPFLQDLEQHSGSSDQHMKKFMSLREGLHVMMQ